jgi:leucyl aminopeptidase
MEIKLSKKGAEEQNVLIVPVFAKTDKLTGRLAEIVEHGEFEANLGEIYSDVAAGQKLIWIGLGEKSKLNPELAKTAGGKAWAGLGTVSNKSVGLLLDKNLKSNLALSLIEGLLLRNYTDLRYKTGNEVEKSQKKLLTSLTIIGEADAAFKKSLQELSKIVDAVHYARDLVMTPSADQRPEDLAAEAAKLAHAYNNVTFEALTKKELQEQGLNLLLAVNRGSAYEPRLIVLQLNHDKKEQPIVLVGKGITFDSGGYNIKPSDSFLEVMHTDMAGAATVLATIKALAELGSKKKVIGIIPATENLVSGDAYKPADIIRSYGGHTVEIKNTDAEGRLILADALSYAIKNFEPKYVVDLATLTGACIVALGFRYAGLFSNDLNLQKQIKLASVNSGEKVWALPLDDTFKDQMKSPVADLANLGNAGRFAGASTGAAFLAHFVGETPWAHIDIAGPSFQSKETEAWNPPTYATGFGVGLLIDLITRQ